jgi:hypothetical protein
LSLCNYYYCFFFSYQRLGFASFVASAPCRHSLPLRPVCTLLLFVTAIIAEQFLAFILYIVVVVTGEGGAPGH